MSDDINREALLRMVNLVRPAIAKHDYIPALKHLLFDGGYISAFNDGQAIQIAHRLADLDLGLCLPGEHLASTLASFNAANVALQHNEKEQSLVVISGRGKVKMKALAADAFQLEMPGKASNTLAISDDILEGFKRCLVAVGNNPRDPASMGVTLDADPDTGKALLFSTDGPTISRYATKSKVKLPGDAPIILPTFFCEQLVSLAKTFPQADVDLCIYPGALVAEFTEEGEKRPVAKVFTKAPSQVDALEFDRVLKKHIDPEKIVARLAPIPTPFDAAFGRALLVLSDKTDKVTKITPTDAAIKLLSVGESSEASDTVTMDGKNVADALDIDEAFFVDPGLIVRGGRSCSTVAFTRRAVVFGDADGQFIHLVAHCAPGA